MIINMIRMLFWDSKIYSTCQHKYVVESFQAGFFKLNIVNASQHWRTGTIQLINP